LVKALRALGYSVTRETWSHIRVTTTQQGEHHVTVPDHEHLRVGTLSAILAEVGAHHRIDREDLLRQLFP
jgi:predicted RNA binding protein YcfA (HicA-like mRNA interferase family)